MDNKIYNELVIYRNNLKFKNTYDFNLIGILSKLVFDNIIDNIELKELIEKTYNVQTEIKDLMQLYFCLINKFKKENLAKEKENFQKELYKWLCQKIDKIKKENNLKDKPNVFDGWLDRWDMIKGVKNEK